MHSLPPSGAPATRGRSLMELLLETMPIAALEDTLKGQYYLSTPPPIALKAAVGKYVKPHLRFLPTGSVPADLAPVLCAKPTGHRQVEQVEATVGLAPGVMMYHERQDIWSFDLSKSAGPAELCDVRCRVSGDGYTQYVVLDRCAAGHEASVGAYEPVVKAVDTAGNTILLPLDDKFLRMTWLTQNTELAVNHPLWKLESHHDKALLRVFVYELLHGALEPTPLAGATPVEQAAFDAVLAACQRIGPGMADSDAAAADLFLDTTFFSRGSVGPVTAEVGGSALLRTARTRVVVAVSWTMCRWRTDFPPGVLRVDANSDGTENMLTGAPLAAARFYPHVMVISNAAFRSFETSIQFDRPRQTTTFGGTSECCGGNEMLPDIKSVLVTEANEPDLLYGGPAPVPIWSSLFSYYQVDGFQHLASTVMHVVRNDAGSSHARPGARVNPSATSAPFITRHADPGLASSLGGAVGVVTPVSATLTKLQGQGEFDSIHMAPPMVASSVAYISGNLLSGFADRTPIAANPALSASFQEIGMAPFCAHDCFHFHWRWSNQFRPGKHGDTQHLGWGPNGPYTEAGRPMVPLNQSIDVWFRAASHLTYHAKIGVDKKPIPAGAWQVVCHHGAAYGLDANSWTLWGAQASINNGLAPYLLDASGHLVSSSSWAALYWRLRYTAQVTSPGIAAQLVERTVFHDLKGARDL
jgi:hypothetical protein